MLTYKGCARNLDSDGQGTLDSLLKGLVHFGLLEDEIISEPKTFGLYVNYSKYPSKLQINNMTMEWNPDVFPSSLVALA